MIFLTSPPQSARPIPRRRPRQASPPKSAPPIPRRGRSAPGSTCRLPRQASPPKSAPPIPRRGSSAPGSNCRLPRQASPSKSAPPIPRRGSSAPQSTAGCHAGLRRRSRLCRHRIAGAPGALCTWRYASRRRSTAARRRPEASLGRSFPRASACWQDGRRSAGCRRLRGPLRRGWRRRRRGLPGPTRVPRGRRNATCRLASRYLRRTPVTGRVGLPPLPARGSARVVAIHSLPHQPSHELPDREVGIHVRQQLPQLLQSALALGVDHRLQLPASVPQRP